MKFSCVIFFFVITFAAHFQRIQAFVSDELLHFKRALDDASNALQDVKESPAINGNVELQRQRRESIDDLLSNSQLDLNLDLEREALDLDNDFLHPLQGRATKNDNKSNNEKGATNVNVNDQLNELVRANSRFQNLHRQLLKSFHGSNSNLNLDMALQKAKAKDVVKSVSGTGTNDKNTNKDKDANRYSNAYKYKANQNSNTGAGNSNKDSYNSDFNWKSDLGVKNNIDFDLVSGKDGSIETPYAQTFSKFDSPQSLNADANHKDAGLASSVLTKAYISCKPLSKNAGPTKTDNTYMEFTSNFHEPESNKESNAKSNLNSFLLLEANNYRNALRAKNIPNMDELQEVSEKKVDPEMHRMMQKVDFPQFRIDFDSSMEDFARKSKSESADDDEPITYEKTIENIHFPNIVNDQFDLARNDLSHEANYKLSKVEQEQSEPRKEHAHSGENNVNSQEMDDKLKAPSKRSSDFNPMDEIKLKTSSRLMAKGFGPSLPSYALSETQHELQLDDAVKNLERNFNADSENNQRDSYRKGSLVSKDILDWQDRLARMDEVEEHSYEKLIYDGTPEASSRDESDSIKKNDEIVIEPTYTLLRKRKILQQPVEDDSHILDLLRARRVTKNPSGDDQVQSLDADSPDDMLLMQLPDRTGVDDNKNLAAEIPAPEVPAPEIPAQEDAADFEQADDENPIGADVDALAEKFKRCGEQEDTNKSSDQIGAPCDRYDDVPNKMPIFKFKRDANKGEDSNAPRRRVKRIGVLNEAGEITGIREVDLGALIDFMTVKELQPKREVVEKSKEGVEEDAKARRSSRVDGINERKPLRPKVLRRHRRELSLTKDEVFNDDTLYVLNGSERMRRSVNKKEICRMRREAEKTETEKTEAEKTEANVTKPEKVETSENRETRKSEPNTEQKADVKKSTTSDLKDANNTDHLMGKRAANIVDDIDDNSSNNRKLLDAALFLSDRGNSVPAHTFRDCPLAQRRAAVTQYGDNDSGNRRFMQAVGRFAGRSPAEISETLDDAAVIAADRRAMNAARAAYARNSARDGSDNEEEREEDYRDLMARLRRLSLQNRGHEADRENDFIKSVDEFGNQKFDNLKEVDQYAREFDGMPVDNLWYGSDPWEEDNNSDNDQQNDVPSEGSANKNRPIPQHTALTIKLEDGAIKSIERSDEQNKENEASVANEKTESEVEEDDGNNESAPFGWFGKSKNKADDAKCRDDGTVVKVNDQLLNCTAFNTLEEFLKSVQQQKNRTDSGKGVGGNASGGGSGNNTISKGGRVEGSHGGGKQGSDGQEIGRQGTSGKGSGGHEGAGRGGDRQGTGGQEGGGHGGGGHSGGGHSGGGHSGGGHSGSGYGGGAKCGNDEQRTSGHEADGHGDYGRYGNAKNGMGNDKKSGSGSGGDSGNRDKEAGSGRVDYGAGGTGNGLGPAGSSCGTTGTDVTPRPLGSSGQKAMKLNITINASVMGDQKAKNFFGNGTIKVQSEDRERRGISFPQITQLKRYAMKRKCAKPKTSSSCDENSIGGKGAMEIVKSIFDMVKCSPQMKPLWASLKRNQQCMKKVPPAESGFEKMQKDDANRIEDMVQQAMEAISDIIDDQVEQRSCLTLPPEMKVFYEQILDTFESNAAEGVREKRDNMDSPNSSIDEFSKEVRLIDPNQIEERSRIVKKLLRQYDDLPAEEQQQMVGVRDNLLQNLGFLESIKEDQTAKKREQAPQSPLEQRLERKPEQQPEEPQAPEQHKVGETETDIQDRWRRELLKQMEVEKGDDEEALKAFNLPYTPEYLRLLKAAELMEEREIRESESRSGENEESGEVALIRQ
ncbi:uncharacterized protein LOC128866579 isoform X2 [Anastrepha ludens]|uniref:uncharacterized protein LOC128866579 isoform X2 n=1 Tax=Anastrepha ludens TaxID=28586 RepID=UPI0023B0A587|nr:uncharacterized protein LOC128866579 isoform X2 [Anastrepha ludens]